MPTLLQINSNAVIGSTGRIAEQLGELALKNGWKSYIAYGRHVGGSKSLLIKIGNNVSVGVHFLLSKLFDSHGFGSYYATKRFIKKIKVINPDVIHLHNIHGYYINIKLLFEYLAETNIPIVWTLHDFWPITGHCAYIPKGCDKWIEGCENCQCRKAYPSSLSDNSSANWKKKKAIFNLPDKIVITPVSQWLGNFVKRSYLSDFEIKVIYNGIDTNQFIPIKTNEPRKKYYIGDSFMILGVASKWTEENRYNEIIELSKKLRKNEIIFLVGISATQQRKLPSNIMGIHATDNISELVELYGTADLLLNISATVTFGLITVEAMACGTPVIVLDRTAGSEIVTTQSGFVINDINELFPIIDEVKSKGKAFYSNACRERVVKMFNKEDKFREYFNLYEDIFSGTFKWKKL
jgi:glycosyltransferase involved in cell wall biosynthesis